MFLIGAIKPNTENKFKNSFKKKTTEGREVGRVQNKSFVSFRVRFVSGNTNII